MKDTHPSVPCQPQALRTTVCLNFSNALALFQIGNGMDATVILVLIILLYRKTAHSLSKVV